MPNLNLQLMLAIHPSKTKKIIPTKNKVNIDNTPMTYLNYSLYATNTHYHINYHSLAKTLEYNRCEKFFIFEILPWTHEINTLINFNHSSYLPISKNNPYYLLTKLSISDFFRNNLIENCLNTKDQRLDNDPIYKHAVFIFHSLPLPFIMVLFRKSNYFLTQGSNAQRGLLSTVHLRLAQFLTCLEGMNKTTVFDSFHNYSRFAVQPYFNHKNWEKLQALKSVKLFYDELEEWLKLKLNFDLTDQNQTFQWDLRKDVKIENQDTFLNYEEFIDYILNKYNK